MTFRGTLIIEGRNEWHIVVANERRSLPKDSQATAIAAAVRQLVEDTNGAKSECIIAPASASCFFTILTINPKIDFRDRLSLIYELEKHIPVDAESMAADFGPPPPSATSHKTADGESAVAIAIEADTWSPLVESIEAEGISVTNIIPNVVLAVASLHEEHSLSGPGNLILCDGDQSDLIAVADDFPLSWKYCNLEPKTLKRHKSLEIQDSSDVLVVGATEEQLQLIREHIGTVSADSTPLLEHQIKGAGIVVAKPDSIHFNLRRDRLAPTDPLRPIQRQLSRLAFAIAICLCLIIAGSWWRSTRIEAKISDTIQAQAAAFKNSFPNSRPPASLLRRIRSEHSRILGSRNASKQIEAPESAVKVLNALLTSLPVETRYTIKAIDIRNGKMDLTFQVRRTVDAGAVAEALSQGGFDVAPPVITQKDAKTFNSTIQAEWREHESKGTNIRSTEAATSQNMETSRHQAHPPDSNVQKGDPQHDQIAGGVASR